MRWRRNRKLDELGKRAFAPPTIPELLALTVALGAYATMIAPEATAPPVEPGNGEETVVNVLKGIYSEIPAGTNTIGKVDADVTTAGGAPSSGDELAFSNQGTKWLDCSQARETSQCVPRDFPNP